MPDITGNKKYKLYVVLNRWPLLWLPFMPIAKSEMMFRRDLCEVYGFCIFFLVFVWVRKVDSNSESFKKFIES